MIFPKEFVDQFEAVFPDGGRTEALRSGSLPASYIDRVLDENRKRFTAQDMAQALNGENRETLQKRVERAQAVESLRSQLNTIADAQQEASAGQGNRGKTQPAR